MDFSRQGTAELIDDPWAAEIDAAPPSRYPGVRAAGLDRTACDCCVSRSSSTIAAAVANRTRPRMMQARRRPALERHEKIHP
jgi:hypothetical protein